ncbi:MAG: thioredoxin family protein [Bacteroidota bacterium]
MKKQNIFLLVIISLILCDSLSLFAQEPAKPAVKESKIKWYSFEDAYNLIKKKPKKIFIDMFTDWCGWCKKMDSETFANPVIAEYMSDNFYCVKFNAERKDTIVLDGQTFVNPNPTGSRSTHKLAVELLRGKLSYPSFVFLNEKGQELTVIAGYQQPREFEKILNWFGSNAYLKTQFEDYKVGFQGKVK